jgi:hypothetical protein
VPIDPSRRRLSNFANRTQRRIFLTENRVGQLGRQGVKGIVERQEDTAQGRKAGTSKSKRGYRPRGL